MMFSNDINVETIGQLVEVLKHYIGLQTEYVKLDVVDKVVRLLTALTVTVVLVGLLMIALIYLSFALAYGLGELIGNVWGFCIVAAIYLFILVVFIIFRHQWIERPLVKFLAGIFMQK